MSMAWNDSIPSTGFPPLVNSPNLSLLRQNIPKPKNIASGRFRTPPGSHPRQRTTKVGMSPLHPSKNALHISLINDGLPTYDQTQASDLASAFHSNFESYSPSPFDASPWLNQTGKLNELSLAVARAFEKPCTPTQHHLGDSKSASRSPIFSHPPAPHYMFSEDGPHVRTMPNTPQPQSTGLKCRNPPEIVIE